MSLDTIQLETSGKGEKIEKTDAVKRLKDIEDIKTYLAKLSQSAPGKARNPLLQEQVTVFLEKAANNGLGKNMEKFNAKKFDIDGEVGLDNFEFEKFSDAIKGAIGQIVALDGANAFDRVHNESQATDGWSNPDKWIAGKADIGKYILGEKGSSSFAEEALKKVGSISPEELHKIQEKPFSLSVESGKDLAILLAKEVGSGVEDLLRFLTNIPSGIILLPRYLSYRMDSNSPDVQKKTEGDIKLGELVESNSSLAIIELLGEKGIDMIKQLANMMKSGKQGDIATILVTIAGLMAGGAGAVKFASSMARKSAVRAAREAGSAGRKAGEVMTRESRNTLRNVSNTAGKVAEVANKVDNIVSGNAALGKVASVAGNGVRKVAPAMSVAANDASNVVEIGTAQTTMAEQVMQATGTNGGRYDSRTTRSKNTGENKDTQVVSLEVRQNANLSKVDRIKKAQEIISRELTPEESKAIDHIHNNISKGIYKNSTTDLMKMARMWEEMTGNNMANKTKFAEFRKLVEHGILGQDIELVVLKEASRKITHDIDVYGVDHILDKIKDRKLNQSQLNAVVFEYFEAHGSSIESLDKFLKNSLDVNGYTGDTIPMFSEAMRYAKEMKFEEFIVKIDEKSVQDIMKHMMTDTENSSKILKSFLENGKSTTKLEFFKSLEYNDTLLSSIVTGEHADIFINAISRHTKDLAKVISSIINNESTLRKMAPENLKTLEVLLEQMIKEENYNGSIIGTLRSKLALARDAKSPKNRIKYFLQNRDEEILAKLRETFSSEKATWNIMFDDYRVQDGGVKERMNMIERGERSFFTQHSLEIFIHLTFPELPLAAQKEFVKKFVAATDAKYHCLIDEFPGFKKEIAEHGWI